MNDTYAHENNSSPSLDQLLRASQGFEYFVWAIPTTLLLLSGAISIQILENYRWASYMLGVITLFQGMLSLRQISSITNKWTTLVRQGVTFSVLLIYFTPLLLWWTRRPEETFLIANLGSFFLCLAWGLFVMNSLAAEIGSWVDDHSFRLEAQLGAWLSALLIIGPLGYIATCTLIEIFRYGNPLFESLLNAYHNTPSWTIAIVILPFSLTMAIAWQARKRCLHALRVKA